MVTVLLLTAARIMLMVSIYLKTIIIYANMSLTITMNLTTTWHKMMTLSIMISISTSIKVVSKINTIILIIKIINWFPKTIIPPKTNSLCILINNTLIIKIVIIHSETPISIKMNNKHFSIKTQNHLINLIMLKHVKHYKEDTFAIVSLLILIHQPTLN